jgi:hypothetical protein
VLTVAVQVQVGATESAELAQSNKSAANFAVLASKRGKEVLSGKFSLRQVVCLFVC